MIKKLTECFGVSGCEKSVTDFIYNEIKDFCTDIKMDSLGNLKVYKKATRGFGKKILLSAHTDEVGLIVTDITEDGYLKFSSVGGINTNALIAQRVKVNGYSGVISLKAIHLTDKEEQKKPLTEENLYIDIGAKNKAEAEKIVRPGDYCCFDSEYIEFGKQIKAKALDDRAGCAVLIEILKRDWDVELYCNFTVQEEVGLRGSKVATRGINPDYALVVEATVCNDITGTEEHQKVTKMAEGPAISVLDSASKGSEELINLIKKSAKEHDIKYQIKASTAGGNDAGSIYMTDGGIKTASVSVPCRYIHTPVSVMDICDYKNCIGLIGAFLEDIGRD